MTWPCSGRGCAGAATAGAPRSWRTWLDTFDWRLFRAGLTLELSTGRGTAQLVLTGRDGERWSRSEPVAGAAAAWPMRLLGALPVGPLRERAARRSSGCGRCCRSPGPSAS